MSSGAASAFHFASDFCERVAPGWWAEPLNTVTSLAFLVGALALGRQIAATRLHEGRWSLALLAVFLGAVGLGSTLLHVTATPWGSALDMVAIKCFLLWFVACFLRWMIGWTWPKALLGIPGLYLLAEAWFAAGEPGALFGLHAYLPALWTLLACTVTLAWRHDPAWITFGWAALGHGASLAMHRLDGELCAWVPVGTHFVWHLVNAWFTYTTARCLVRRAAMMQGGVASSIPGGDQRLRRAQARRP